MGKNKPSGIYRFVFYGNLLISLSFLLWHLIAFVSIFFRNEIFEHKQNLNVNEILINEAYKLGFQSVDFILKLDWLLFVGVLYCFLGFYCGDNFQVICLFILSA